MIIKCPIYVEFEDKMTPDQVAEFNRLVTDELTKYLHGYLGKKSNITFLKRKVNYSILTWKQVSNKLGSNDSAKIHSAAIETKLSVPKTKL